MKYIFKGLNWGVIMLLVFGGILLWQSVPSAIVSLTPAVSFDDMLEEDTVIKNGTHVDGRVPYVLDYFASESTYTQHSNGSRTGDRASGRYYLVPVWDGFIAMKGRQSDVAVLDDLIDETWEYLMTGEETTTEFSMTGVVRPLDDSKLVKYYNEYLIDLGYTEAELEEMGGPLLVQTVNFTACWVMLGIGLALLVLAILLFRRSYRFAKYGSGLSRAEDLPDVPENDPSI